MISRKRADRDLSFGTTSGSNGQELVPKRPRTECPPLIATLYSLNTGKYPNLSLSASKQCLAFGRSKKRNNDHILSEVDCSSTHCMLSITNAGPNGARVLAVRDVSSNGTFVNDVLVGKENTLLLRDGDKLSMASNVHYIVRYETETGRETPSFFDKYVLTPTVLGTGHYAQVKEAVDRESGEVCAVKIFHPTAKNNESQANLFNRELNILTELNHPNIVGFYSTFLEPVSESSITTYLVLEKVNGGELFNRIVTKGKLAQNESREIMRQLVQGLAYLHSKDIVHRDLKPENILLSITPGPQTHPWDAGESCVTVKIADFGLAKFIGNIQFTNTLCGTPAYVAPEVLANPQDRKYNRAVDMWSVGVLLYVCLCGFPPFSDDLAPPNMRQQILQGKYAFYSPYWDPIQDVVLDLISRLLVVDPNERLRADQMLIHPWLTTPPTLDVVGPPGSTDAADTSPSLTFGIQRIPSVVEPTTLQNSLRNRSGDLSMSK